MKHLIGALMFVAGTIIGLFGDYPFGGFAHQNVVYLAVGGLLCGAGLAILLLGSGGRGGGREDEPPSYIRP